MAAPPSSVAPLFLLCLVLTNAHSLHLPSPTRGATETAAAAASASAGASGSFSAPSALLATLRTTLTEIRSVMSVISAFPIGGFLFGGDHRLSSAVSDCLDLLDLSSDEINWSLSTTGSPGGTGDARSDLRSWLSAALGNQDTCKEGLDATGSALASIAAAGLRAVTSLLADGLAQLAGDGTTSISHRARARARSVWVPRWVGNRERRLLQLPLGPGGLPVDAVVSQDGSGNYTTVGEALAAAPSESGSRYVIYVKRGVYKETVEVKKNKWNVMLVGDGMGETVISGHRNFVDGSTTFRSATVAVNGKGFIARDLTIENTSGAAKHQAVALRSDSDLSVFYRCAFEGFQDTLYAHSLRQFYRDCRITGTIDFVFGNAAAVFQNCVLLARLPLPTQKNIVTAQGRLDPNMTTGFSFQFCNVSAHDELLAAPPNQAPPTYLGRPWKQYSRTVFMQSYIGGVVRPEGWLEWDGQFALDTLFYGEYMNTGPGAGVGARVKWPGYHVITDPALAGNFTVAQFIEGNMWLPPTGVKYTAGLAV